MASDERILGSGEFIEQLLEEVARLLGVTTSSVNRLAVSDELPESTR